MTIPWLVMYMLVGLFLLIIFVFAKFLSMKISFSKNSPFECGVNPMVISRSSFSLQFAMTALLFILFDIELVSLIPIPIMVTFNLDCVMILLILFIGLMYEWELLSWD